MKIDMINKKGVRVRVNSKHAKVLAKIGVLTYPPVEEVKAPPLSLPKKGTYARRDMVAETRFSEPVIPEPEPRYFIGQGKPIDVKT